MLYFLLMVRPFKSVAAVLLGSKSTAGGADRVLRHFERHAYAAAADAEAAQTQSFSCGTSSDLLWPPMKSSDDQRLILRKNAEVLNVNNNIFAAREELV